MQQPFMYVETDQGRAGIYKQGPRGKNYKCPVCEEQVEGEWHYVIKPHDETFRRHAHSECIDKAIEYKISIRLTPGRH